MERRNKYNAKRTEHNGRTYASKAEAEYAATLDALQAAGEVVCWIPQPKFPLVPGYTYTPDFLVIRRDKLVSNEYTILTITVEAVEVKGRDTTLFRRHVEMWRQHGRIPLRIVRRGKPDEIIEPRQQRESL